MVPPPHLSNCILSETQPPIATPVIVRRQHGIYFLRLQGMRFDWSVDMTISAVFAALCAADQSESVLFLT